MTSVYRIDSPRLETWAEHDRRLGITPPAPPRATYVYRLIVTRPEGSDAPGWEPENWAALCRDRGWSAENADGYSNFHWPTRTKFFSGGAAAGRAKMLREYGAEVLVQRSLPVEWDEES